MLTDWSKVDFPAPARPDQSPDTLLHDLSDVPRNPVIIVKGTSAGGTTGLFRVNSVSMSSLHQNIPSATSSKLRDL